MFPIPSSVTAPATPVNQSGPHARSASTTPESDWDESPANDLSFEYVEGENGQIIRRSKGSSSTNPCLSPSPSPCPSPLLDEDDYNSPQSQQRHSLHSEDPPREPFQRSASLQTKDSPDFSPAAGRARSRSFQRVTSGPAFGISSGLLADQPKNPRRVTMEESNHIQASLGEDHFGRVKPVPSDRREGFEQEKENLRRLPPSSSVTSGGGRIMRSAPSDPQQRAYQARGVTRLTANHRVGRISEVDDPPLDIETQEALSEDTEISASFPLAGLFCLFEHLFQVEAPAEPSRAPIAPGLIRQRTYGGTSRRPGSDEGPIDVLLNSGNVRPRRSASTSDVILAAPGTLHIFSCMAGAESFSQKQNARPTLLPPQRRLASSPLPSELLVHQNVYRRMTRITAINVSGSLTRNFTPNHHTAGRRETEEAERKSHVHLFDLQPQ